MKRIASFCSAILLSATVLLFSTCQKEYSYEGGPVSGSSGTAVYTFEGAGGNCTAVMVNGVYYTGTPLNATNTIQLQVDVTVTGTYIVNTFSIDGFKFSSSGNFASTGIQVITLTGIGTPATEGNITFHTPATPACSFTVTVSKAPVAIASFTLAGAPSACTAAKVNGDYFAGTTLTGLNTVELSVDVTIIGAYTLKTDTIDAISFSASGTFTSTGIQTVILVGSGTPDIPRNLSFTPAAGTSSCNFPVTVLPTGPLATYVLESGFGTPNPCVYTIAGTYNAGTPLTVANSITMRVYVTALGNFAIATDVNNGMLFAFTGTFTATGSQYVTLRGIGTPLSAGTFSFIPQIVGPHPLGGQACGTSITVN